jgi:phosphatidylserine synthase 2
MYALIIINLIIVINFLCGFFLINNLWIPPKNNFNKLRLIIWFCLGNLAFKEAY